jgi:diguanylate cyclase (GGDEF)-like protein/PAS domain S-box-containing protein
MPLNERPKILLIDDTPENLFLLATALEAEFDLQLAASGPEGVKLAKASPPDLILLDIMMPEVDGYETFRRFRNVPALVNTPIIFVTAISDLESEVAGLALGAADYITKPIKVELVRHRIRNILRLTRMEHDLKSSEERLRLVMNATGEGIWDWKINTGEVSHNPMWCRMLGLDEKYLSHPVEEYSNRIHEDDALSVRKSLNQALLHGTPYHAEYRLRHEDGRYIWVSDRGSVVSRQANGSPERMVGSVTNIDERKRNEAEIHKLAFYDALTNLPNRRLSLDRLQQAILKNQRSKAHGALIFLDMDRFKQLNDQHGHAMGDVLLMHVSERLVKCVRAQDTVARLGGDEFIVILENLDETQETALLDATRVCQVILERLNQPYQLREDLSYASTPSIGLTLFNGMGDDVNAVLKRADAAMYQAKEAGKNTICIHNPATSKQLIQDDEAVRLSGPRQAP